MNTPTEEIRTDYQKSKGDVTIIIAGVPMRVLKDMYGNEHETCSIDVAMRLEELTNCALEADSTPGTVHHLEF
ncbi:MAG: hypothetical protein HC933_07325 [Pleurocapsa sp. SU_196_0]|nr:hypothetical protein [Pleurocapsa sp. SU_196_0]